MVVVYQAMASLCASFACYAHFLFLLTGASLSLTEQDRFFAHTVIRYTLIIFIGVAKRSLAVNSGTLAKCENRSSWFLESTT